MNQIARALSALLLAALPAACSGPSAPPARGPLEGAAIGGAFTLTDQDGRRVSDRDFAGRYRIMYFGYTFCPDVCPVDVQTIAAALRTLEASDPAIAARIVPIFVTVDPRRDTPAVLKQFVRAFHPRMVGLTGTPTEIAAMTKTFAIYAKAGEAASGGGYLVDHGRTAYLMDPEGKPVALLPQDESPAAVVAEIKRWVR